MFVDLNKNKNKRESVDVFLLKQKLYVAAFLACSSFEYLFYWLSRGNKDKTAAWNKVLQHVEGGILLASLMISCFV